MLPDIRIAPPRSIRPPGPLGPPSTIFALRCTWLLWQTGFVPDERSGRRDALPRGCVLRDYTIEEVLGHGGFGIVYKARHNELDHVVAIKEYLPSELAVREGTTISAKSGECETHFADGLRRFREEAKALIEFQQHPSIVDCREFFRLNGTAYLVIEYVDGLPLSELLREREAAGQPFTESDLLAIAVPLAQGLAHIHRAGVIHRDIKPSNILVRRADHGPVLIDFGAAKQAVAEHSRSLAPYTEGYAALEQVADGQLGPWTDLYGFGAVLWRMVAGGNRPWEPPNPVKVESRANARVREVDDPLPSAKELGAGRFTQQLLEMIDGCLQLRDTERIRETDHVVRLLGASCSEERQTAAAGPKANGGVDVDQQDPVREETKQQVQVDPVGTNTIRDPDEASGHATRMSVLWGRLLGTFRCSRITFAEIVTDRGSVWPSIAMILFAYVLSILAWLLGALTSAEAWQSLESSWAGTPGLVKAMGPVILIGIVAYGALVLRIASRLFNPMAPSYGGWFRVLGFIILASIFIAFVPIVGGFISMIFVYCSIVVAMSEFSRTPVYGALSIVIIAGIIANLAIAALVIIGILGGLYLPW